MNIIKLCRNRAVQGVVGSSKRESLVRSKLEELVARQDRA